MKKTGIILLIIFASYTLYAQGRYVQGFVHTLDNIPLIGAEINVKSTKKSVFTDSVGHFIAHCYTGDKLKIKARGFYDQKVKIAQNTKVVAVNLKLKPGEKNRKYAIGYGYVTEEDKTMSVSGVNTTDEKFLRYNNMYELIRDYVPGAQEINGEIVLRGDRSFQGSNAALIVVDGTIVDASYLDGLPPVDVKSVDVLKDGSAAVYGSRGANGVILIETKRGGDE
jgi:TonB-dependent SusC/RagA subfamily outer membrane receptor